MVRCINPSTDAPYPLDKFGKSTCEFCRRTCIAACEASAVQNIMSCHLMDDKRKYMLEIWVAEAKDSSEIFAQRLENAENTAFLLAARMMEKN